ncbi:MAG TPA: urea ABC transporter permease subunit UrtB [Polyangiaceae bacterium]|nr:urea ABC transporter permease subunit UrtB [Polyangiaceae bacterium]
MRFWLALAAALVLLTGSRRVLAEGFDAAVAGLARASPDDVARAVEAIGASGDPRALPILQALSDGELRVDDDGHAYIYNKDGSLRDVSNGTGTAGPGHPPSIDNGVRRVLGPLIARLGLQSSDPDTRLAAVADLARRASEEDQPALRDALAKERVRSVRRALISALAEADLASEDAQLRLAAVRAIEDAGSLNLAPKVQALTGPGEPDAGVRDAAKHAVRSLHRKQTLVDGAADVLYGMSTGSILLLAALGLAITFGLMRVINMAHGEMVMLGAYATYSTQTFFHDHFPQSEPLYLVAAVPVALVSCMVVGALLERTVIRHLYGRPLETLLATYGLSLLLIQIVRSTFGAQNVEVQNPPWLSGGFEVFEDVVIPYNRMAVVLFTVVVVGFVAYVLRGTSLGLRVRAVTQNRPMAACMGISTARVDTWTFALGCGVGGLGGVALSQLGNVGPELGQGVIVDSFLVVVLGGVGKTAGSVVAAFGLGILNKVLEPIAGAVLAKILVLMAIVLVIQKRPQGLFAPKGRSVETA